MRIVAMIQVYNNRRVIAACIEHLRGQGVDVYLIDNESTDETVAIAERYLDRGVIDIETLPCRGRFNLKEQCARQEAYGQQGLTFVDRFGVYLSRRAILRWRGFGRLARSFGWIPGTSRRRGSFGAGSSRRSLPTTRWPIRSFRRAVWTIPCERLYAN